MKAILLAIIGIAKFRNSATAPSERGNERRNRVLFELSVRDIQHHREQLAIALALRSGTAGKLLG